MSKVRKVVYYKRGNTWPPIDDIISDRHGPINTSLATQLRFLMRKGGPDGELVTTGTATAGNVDTLAADGGISYAPVAGDTDDVGTFFGEWELTFAGPVVASAPNKIGEYITIIIGENLA